MNGSENWQPNILLQRMESDLSLLPMYFAQPGDYIICDKKPSETFCNQLNLLGFEMPNAVTKKELAGCLKQGSTIDHLLPWGWSPAEHKFLAPLKPCCTDAFQNSPVFNWKPEQRELYSKKFASNISHRFLEEIDSNKILGKDQANKICSSKTEIEKLVEKWGKVMIKAPWSSSGRGLQPISKMPVHAKVWEKVLGIIKDQGFVIVEPLLKKAFDLAFQFQLENKKIKFLGISNFFTDKKGQYQGKFLNGLPPDLPLGIIEFVNAIPDEIISNLIKLLEESDLAIYYNGYFGVDTLVFWDDAKNLKINPCLEINVRHSMGLLSLRLEKLIQPNQPGIFSIYYDPKKTFFEFAHEMEDKYPLVISKQKIHAGFFPLIDINEHTMFGAYLLVK
jgi:hypothetical protein